jgi:hypothetical protein
MDGQMTIFDFLPPPEDDLETLDEEVMVARIAERTGLIFKKQPSDRWLEHPTYEAKYKKATIEVQYSRYDTLDDNNNKRFIGVGYSFAKGGGGSPCDTLTKAVDRIKRYQQTIDGMDKPKRKCCNNCNHYRMTVDATTCEPKYMICHRPGTCYGDQITNPESYVCEFWEEKGENDDN